MIADTNNAWQVTGESGTGKTYGALWMLRRYVAGNRRRYYIVVSNKGLDFDNPQHPAPLRPKVLGFARLQVGRDLTGRIDWSKVLRRTPRLFVETTDITDQEGVTEVERIAKSLWSLKQALFFIDEAWAFLHRDYKHDEVMRLARGGRASGIDLMCVSQRVYDIHPNIRSQLRLKVAFRATDERDKGALRSMFAPINGRPADEVIERFERGQFAVADKETGRQELGSTFDRAFAV